MTNPHSRLQGLYDDFDGPVLPIEPDDRPPPLAERLDGNGSGRPTRGDPARRFRLIPFAAIAPDARPRYLVKCLLPRVGLGVVWGPPKCGKSFWTFDLMMHIALGRDYRGHRVKQGAVVYCALEGAEGFKRRVEAFRRQHLADTLDAAPPFHLMASPLNLVADCAAFLAAIRNQLGETKPAAVVIDTLNRSLAGSESDDRDMAAYVRAADAIRDAFDCLVVIVHHCGHEGKRPRGHSSLIGAGDVQIAVKRDALENIIAEVEHAKDGAAGLVFTSRLESVDLGVDDDGDAITSCVILPVDDAAETKPRRDTTAKLPKGAQIALRALHEAVDDLGEVPPACSHIPRNVKAAKITQWREYAYRMGVSSSEEARARRQAFQRASEALITAREVAVWEPFVWAVR